MKKPTLQELVTGKSNAVAAAVATHSKKLAAAAQDKSKKVAVKKSGSGALIKTLLTKGMETEKILVAVKKAFPESKATAADVAWNRWAMKKK